ncbi:MAG TPA: hypothetical protein VIU11_24785 [Nakamurella sp.]
MDGLLGGDGHIDRLCPPHTVPKSDHQWSALEVSGTFPVVMGDRGRLFVPIALRERLKAGPGTAMLLVDTPRGVLLVTRDQARELVKEPLSGHDVVTELLADRRREAAAEDA